MLGGARSGKSRHAETLVESLGGAPLYVATAEPRDEEMRLRIAQHRARRGARWTTIEEPLALAATLRECTRDGVPVLVDCLTLWLANVLEAGRAVAAEIEALLAALARLPGPVVLVANEVGLGIVPENALARQFRDHAGRLNRETAALADPRRLHRRGPAARPKGRSEGGALMRKLPVTIVTGFLGAGKTSLVRHLLTHAAGRRIGLLVNEFGELGIDRELLLACGDACADDQVIELANGCICCTVAEDFLPALTRLLDAAAARPIMSSSRPRASRCRSRCCRRFNWPEIKARVTVDGVIAVIDAAALASGLAQPPPGAGFAAHDDPVEEVFGDQLMAADLAVLNKTDLVDGDALAAARRALGKRLRPGVACVDAAHGALPAHVLLGLEASAEDDIAGRPSCHDLELAHDHDDFESFVVVARADRRSGALCRAPRRTHRAAQDPAAQRFRRCARPCLPPRRPGRGAARRALFRPAVASGRGASLAPRRDRLQGARSRGHRGCDRGLSDAPARNPTGNDR